MSTAEQDRHDLHDKLQEAIGRDEAATLMSYLPPVGWADVATKHDLVNLEKRFDRLEARMDRMETASAVQARTFTLSMVGSVLTTAALAFGAAHLV